MPPITYTLHATQRSSQRSIRRTWVEYAIRYGRRYHHNGGMFYFLRKSDIRPEDRRQMERAAGLTVMVDETNHIVITSYFGRRLRW